MVGYRDLSFKRKGEHNSFWSKMLSGLGLYWQSSRQSGVDNYSQLQLRYTYNINGTLRIRYVSDCYGLAEFQRNNNIYNCPLYLLDSCTDIQPGKVIQWTSETFSLPLVIESAQIDTNLMYV